MDTPKAAQAQTQKAKLTTRRLKEFQCKASPGEKLWDTRVRGFHVLAIKDGLSFRLFYRNAEGQQRTITFGRYGDMTADEAKIFAESALGRIARGEDVQETKAETKRSGQDKRKQTLEVYLEGVYTAYQARKKTGHDTLCILRRHFKGWLKKPMGSITPRDVARWQAEKEAEGLHFATIKRTYGAFKTCLNHAVKTGTIESHQLAHCQLEKPHLTEQELAEAGTGRRYLSTEETEAFFRGMDAYQEEKRQQRRNTRAHGRAWMPDFDAVPYVDHVKPWMLTMFYTGMRPGDLFGLRWEHVNLQFRTIRKTIEKTAHHQPEPRTFPLSLPLVDVLKAWHAQNGKPETGYVFPSQRTSGRMDKKAMQGPWRKVKALSGLSVDLELYTLRHNFASQLILSGADLLTVSKLMGHTDIQTTIRHYGHLRPDLARNYVDQFASTYTPCNAGTIGAAAGGIIDKSHNTTSGRAQVVNLA